MSAAAKLPDDLIRLRPKLVATLQPGEGGFLDFTRMQVSKQGDCFLDPAGEVLPAGRDYLGEIEVRRDEIGFHVIVPRNLSYDPGKIPPGNGSIPVPSITVGPPDSLIQLLNMLENGPNQPPDGEGAKGG